jgi:chromosome segregation ATPase
MAKAKSSSASAKNTNTAAARIMPAKPAVSMGMEVTPAQRYQMIAEAAYFHAEKRGFTGGDPAQDWLEAEAEIDRILRHASKPGGEVSTKQVFQDRLEAQLKEWDAKLDELKAKALAAGSDLRTDYEKQLEVLSAKREALQTKAQDLRKRTEEAWDDLKSGTEKAWDDMREALDRITSRFK